MGASSEVGVGEEVVDIFHPMIGFTPAAAEAVSRTVNWNSISAQIFSKGRAAEALLTRQHVQGHVRASPNQTQN